MKIKFFTALEEELVKAALQGKSAIIMGDLNSKLGAEFIRDDPKPMSENGKILGRIIHRNALTVVNGMRDKCEGLITRERRTTNSVEKSVIDVVIVSQDLVPKILSMMIDDDRKYVLTKLTKKKSELQKKESDHNTIVTKLNDKWKTEAKEKKREIYNMKNKESQMSYKKETDCTRELSDINDKDESVEKLTKKILKRLDGFVHNNFKKIRVTEKIDKELEKMYS